MKFYKYQGTGNDFVIIDDRGLHFPMKNKALIAHLCNRRFGIGADGLMLLQNAKGYDFRMVYYNADGGESSMCGNGGRCMARFAQQLGIVKNKTSFVAVDGAHEALLTKKIVRLKMNDVSTIEKDGNNMVMNTGSPHYVIQHKGVQQANLISMAHAIRYNKRFKAQGINVNLIEGRGQSIQVRTYERGVEDETLSCGTGVTASAIAWSVMQNKKKPATQLVKVKTPGGQLEVSFTRAADGHSFSNIWLCGPAELVYSGEVVL